MRARREQLHRREDVPARNPGGAPSRQAGHVGDRPATEHERRRLDWGQQGLPAQGT